MVWLLLTPQRAASAAALSRNANFWRKAWLIPPLEIIVKRSSSPYFSLIILEKGLKKCESLKKKSTFLLSIVKKNHKSVMHSVLSSLDMLWMWIHSFICSLTCFELFRCQMWLKSPQESVDFSSLHSLNTYLYRDCFTLVTVLDKNVAW